MSTKLKNYYTLIPKSNQNQYSNYDKLHIDLNSRIILLGASGSLKTNTCLNLIENINAFEQIYIIARQVDEPLYELIQDIFAPVEKKIKKKILFISSNISDLPPIDSFSSKIKSLVIFDDLVNGSKAEFAIIKEFYLRGRKLGITSIFISQSWFAIPQLIRQNTNIIIIKKISSVKDFKRIIAEFSLDKTVEQLKELYDYVRQRDPEDFMLIDLSTNDEGLRYRYNFDRLGC